MREIVFRGKRVDTGEWIYGSLVEEPYGNPSISDHSSVSYSRYEVDPNTVGQFTGRFDKHKTKVFEGDITNYGVVEYFMDLVWDSAGSSHPGFYFREAYYPQQELSWHEGFDDELEIIGNTTDNPELNKEPTNAR